MKKILYALLLTLWALLPPVMTGVITTVGQVMTPAAVYLLQGLLTGTTVLVMLLISRRKHYVWFRLRTPDRGAVVWLLPIVLIEVLPFLVGRSWRGNAVTLLGLVFCMVTVGLAEELIFRGFILRRFRETGVRSALLASSLFFSLGHAANLMNGQNLAATLHQLLFALLFGLVAAELVIITGSLSVGIGWHIVHNLIATLTGSRTAAIENTVLILQLVLLAGLAVLLWKRAVNAPEISYHEVAKIKTRPGR